MAVHSTANGMRRPARDTPRLQASSLPWPGTTRWRYSVIRSSGESVTRVSRSVTPSGVSRKRLKWGGWISQPASSQSAGAAPASASAQRNGLVGAPVPSAGPSVQPDVGAVRPRRQRVLPEDAPEVGRPELPSGIAQRVISHLAGAHHVTLALVAGDEAVVLGNRSVGVVSQRGAPPSRDWQWNCGLFRHRAGNLYCLQ